MSTNRNINDIIVDKIHATFIELVPEDELREIVAKSIDEFKAPRVTQTNQYNKEVKPSKLEEYILKAVADMVTQSVDIHLKEILSPKIDEHGKMIASSVIDEAIKAATPVIIEAFVSRSAAFTVEMALGNFRNELRSNGMRF